MYKDYAHMQEPCHAGASKIHADGGCRPRGGGGRRAILSAPFHACENKKISLSLRTFRQIAMSLNQKFSRLSSEEGVSHASAKPGLSPAN
jgi:hypothetical protein